MGYRPVAAPLRNNSSTTRSNAVSLVVGRTDIPPSTANASATAAGAHARDMVRDGYFAHERPGGAWQHRWR